MLAIGWLAPRRPSRCLRHDPIAFTRRVGQVGGIIAIISAGTHTHITFTHAHTLLIQTHLVIHPPSHITYTHRPPPAPHITQVTHVYPTHHTSHTCMPHMSRKSHMYTPHVTQVTHVCPTHHTSHTCMPHMLHKSHMYAPHKCAHTRLGVHLRYMHSTITPHTTPRAHCTTRPCGQEQQSAAISDLRMASQPGVASRREKSSLLMQARSGGRSRSRPRAATRDVLQLPHVMYYRCHACCATDVTLVVLQLSHLLSHY